MIDKEENDKAKIFDVNSFYIYFFDYLTNVSIINIFLTS